jgi:L-ascorbate metabolism protein UlaG (beta-lactamase superfamily)
MPLLTGRRLARARASKQFRDGKFHNTYPLGPTINANSLALMGDFFFGGKKRVPSATLPVENPVPVWASAPTTGLRVTWLGHSSLFLEIDGVRILTDPVFGDYAAPFPMPGRKRFHPVPAKLSEFPKIDVVLQSHDHYDHLCAGTWKQISWLGLPVITSLGVGARLEKLGVAESLITELDWWEHHTLPNGHTQINATPAQHFSGRSLGDRNATLWSSWAISSNKHRIFFSGDTGLNNELAEIGKRFGPFDLTMLEIGASHPAWADIHLGPANAMTAFQMLGGGTLLPIHWGTFDLALHEWDEPPETLLSLAAKSGEKVITPPIGRPVEPSLVVAPTPWWRELSRTTR